MPMDPTGVGWLFLGREGLHHGYDIGQDSRQVRTGGARVDCGRRRDEPGGRDRWSGCRVRLTDHTGDDHLVDGRRFVRVQQRAGRLQCPHRHAERRGRDRRPQNQGRRPRRPDQPDRGRDRRPGRRLQEPGGHRVHQPPVLPRRQVPAAGGPASDRRLLRRAGVGQASLHQHVRLGRGQRRRQVPGQHGHRRIHEGARRHGRLLVRLRDLAFVEPLRRWHEPLVRTRRAASRGCSTRPSRSAPWP